MRRTIALTLVALFLSDVPAWAETVEVASLEALAAALEAAGPGALIRMAPGDYGAIALRGVTGGPDAPIVLTSIDPARPARLSGIALRDVAHVELRDLALDYTFAAGDPSHQRPFEVVASRDVTLSGLVIDGDDAQGVSSEADGYPTAFGLGVTDVEGFTLEGSEIRGFLRGLVVARSTDVTIRHNDLHGLRSDGMDFAQVSRVLIQGNFIHDFDRSLDSGDHADMIQFWTNGTEQPSTDVTIRGNLLASGAGSYTQSIFIRNEQVDKGIARFDDMAYRNVRIEDNVIINAHLHGITVGEVDGLVIANNAVLRNALSEGEDDNPGLWTPQVRVSPAARDVEIRRNVVARVEGFEGQPDWRLEDNLMVQDRAPSEPGYYALVFAGVPAGDPRDPATFTPRQGGPLDGTGIGPGWLGRRGAP